ncbi:TlpA family protein disulfide reductase [bacterium]|nr:MAG: TlpA family protein disulfide reductase [bacterium]
MKKVLMATAVILALAVGFSESWAARLNEKAPAFALPGIDDRPVSLADFKGNVVFINFWASWCGPCKQELPEINKLMEKYKDTNAVCLAINIDKKKAHAIDFLAKLPKVSRKLLPLLDTDSKVIPVYGAAAMPTSFILDKEGVVRYIHYGFNEHDPAKWADEINTLLKK